jgi:hypothetical protein
MAVLLADKITHLTAARYFAARGFDWICFDLSDDSGLSPAAVAAIREWLEGPGMALYLPFGLRSLAPELLSALAPDGLVAGHFAPKEPYNAEYTLFKEWKVDNIQQGIHLTEGIHKWPEADFHILRCEDLASPDIFTLLETLRPLTATHALLLACSLNGADWETLLRTWPDIGHVFRAPDEQHPGLLSFEALDEQLDLLE